MFTTNETRWLVVALLFAGVGLAGWLAGYQRQAMDIMPANFSPVVEKAKPPRADVRPAEPKLVDLNLASIDELDALPGVGPTLAQRIIEARHRLGRFATPQDLDQVPGVGPATLKRLLPLVTVAPE